jgi:phosphatidylserine decarboxylase
MNTHREGLKILNSIAIIFCLIIVGLRWWVGANWILWTVTGILLLLYIFIMYFFRVPKRIPVIDEHAIIAPADGTIIIIEETEETEYLKTRCKKVSIFMSIFNVHINWFPIGGVIEYFNYHPGKYLVAKYPKASENNERTTVVVNHNGTKVLFRQIAGLIARRIVYYSKEGIEVRQGQESGFIKFGSRVDIFLPPDAEVNVRLGQKVTGTQTVIARLK